MSGKPHEQGARIHGAQIRLDRERGSVKYVFSGVSRSRLGKAGLEFGC